MSTQATITADVHSLDQGSAAGAIQQSVIPSSVAFRMPNGTSEGQIDLVWQRQLTFPDSGTPINYDLDGAMVNAFGELVTFVELTTIYLVVISTTGGDGLSIGPGATDPIVTGATSLFGSSGSVVVPKARSASEPGIALLHSPQGVPISSGASQLDVTRLGSGTVTAIIKFIGRSA